MTSHRLAPFAFSILVAVSACGGVSVGGIGPDPASDAAPTRDAASADGTPPPVPDGSSGSSCASDAACPSGQACAWPTGTDSCDALIRPLGTCVRLANDGCGAVMSETACGCGGKEVTWTSGCVGFPPGWAPSPIEHAGPCTQLDAGGDAREDCQTSKDCQAGYECGFEAKEGCAATGQCLPVEDFPLCNCVGLAACGCNGETLYESLICCGGSYLNVPIAHEGACADGGS